MGYIVCEMKTMTTGPVITRYHGTECAPRRGFLFARAGSGGEKSLSRLGFVLKGGRMEEKSSAEAMIDMLIEEKNWEIFLGSRGSENGCV